MGDEYALEMRDLTAGYNGDTVIEDIDLTIEKGGFFGLIGPNGGGKTTLLKVILGLIKPMEGAIRVFGLPPKEGRKYMGYVPQHSIYDPDFPISVQEVVLMGRKRHRGNSIFYSDEDRETARSAMQSMNILELADRNISDLSGGQRQRAYIARALASEPKMLLLDEPTAGIDPQTSQGTYGLLKELNRTITIMIATHDVGAVSKYVKKIGCLNRYLFTHDDRKISQEMLDKAYSCPVDLIAHGVPHRVFPHHVEDEEQ